jgi:hypothetical protein
LRSEDFPTFGCPTNPMVNGSAGPSCSVSLSPSSPAILVSFATTRCAPFGTSSDQSRSRRTGDFQFAAFSGSSRIRAGGVDNLRWAVCNASTSSSRDSWGISGRCLLLSISFSLGLLSRRKTHRLEAFPHRSFERRQSALPHLPTMSSTMSSIRAELPGRQGPISSRPI